MNEWLEKRFDFMPPMLDGVEIWRICWQKEEMASRFFNQLLCLKGLVKSCIIHNDSRSFRKDWKQDFFKPCVENISVAAPLKGKRGDKSLVEEPSYDTHPLSFLAWDIRSDLLTSGRSCVFTKQTVVHTCFIKVNHLLWIQLRQGLLEF